MKRNLCLMLAFLSLCFTSAFADEIRFRGISWDTDAQSFWNIIHDELGEPIDPDSWGGQYLLEVAVKECSTFWYKHFESDRIITSLNHLDNYPVYSILVFCSDDVFVAGYPVSSIDGFAIPRVENGIVCSSPSDNRMINASYRFDLDRISAPYADVCNSLRDKLTALYGNAYSIEIVNDFTSILWLGENDTYVDLSFSFPEPGAGLSHLGLEYGVLNAPALIDLIENPESTIDPSSIDGL